MFAKSALSPAQCLIRRRRSRRKSCCFIHRALNFRYDVYWWSWSPSISWAQVVHSHASELPCRCCCWHWMATPNHYHPPSVPNIVSPASILNVALIATLPGSVRFPFSPQHRSNQLIRSASFFSHTLYWWWWCCRQATHINKDCDVTHLQQRTKRIIKREGSHADPLYPIPSIEHLLIRSFVGSTIQYSSRKDIILVPKRSRIGQTMNESLALELYSGFTSHLIPFTCCCCSRGW